MQITAIGFFVLAVLQLNWACSRTSPDRSPARATPQGLAQNRPNIDEQKAVAAATRDAREKYGSLEKYSVVACDGGGFWHIFLEPKDPALTPRGILYHIAKGTDFVLAHRDFVVDRRSAALASGDRKQVTKDEAVAIANRDGVGAYGTLDDLDMTVCELSGFWAVLFSPKEGLLGGGPEYFIDKETGRILDKKYYQ